MSSFLGNDEVRREAKNRLHQFSSPAPPSIHWVDLKESFTQLESSLPLSIKMGRDWIKWLIKGQNSLRILFFMVLLKQLVKSQDPICRLFENV